MSTLLHRLEGHIDDVDLDAKADLETRLVLSRYLLRRFGVDAEQDVVLLFGALPAAAPPQRGAPRSAGADHPAAPSP